MNNHVVEFLARREACEEEILLALLCQHFNKDRVWEHLHVRVATFFERGDRFIRDRDHSTFPEKSLVIEHGVEDQSFRCDMHPPRE